jgi:hypothetical protein
VVKLQMGTHAFTDEVVSTIRLGADRPK